MKRNYQKVGNQTTEEKKFLYDEENNLCPAAFTMELIHGKWKSILLYILFQRPHRFNELYKRLPNISQKVLSQQLKSLVKSGIVKRKSMGGVPPTVIYSITDFGKTLEPVIEALYDWGKEAGDNMSTENKISKTG